MKTKFFPKYSRFKIFLVMFLLAVTSPFTHANSSLVFDGVDEYVAIPYTANLNPTSFTLSCWVKSSSINHTSDKAIAGSVNSSASAGYGFLLNTKNFWILSISDGGFSDILFPHQVKVDQWYHLAGTYDGSTLSFYVNGNLVGTANYGMAQNTTDPFTIGGWFNDLDMSFHGEIDEVRLWNTPLTQAQILANMNTELTGAEANLVAYYNMNAGTGTIATDNTGNGHDGNFVNMETTDWSTAKPVLTPIVYPAASVTDSEFTINWKPVDGATKYFVDISTTSNFSVNETTDSIEVVAPNISYIFSTANSSTTYYFRVRSFTSEMSENSLPQIVSTTMPIPGLAIELDGADDYITTPFVNSLDKQNFMIETWFKIDGPDNMDYKIISTGSNVHLLAFLSHKLRFCLDGNCFLGTTDVDDGEWHHAALVGTSSDYILYLDGKEDTRVSSSAGSFSGYLTIGNVSGEGTFYCFDGRLDETRIWNKSKTLSEIKSNMHDIIDPDANPELLLYYSYDQDSGRMVYDKSVNGYHGYTSDKVSGYKSSVAVIKTFARSPINITSTSFTALWDEVPAASSYYLEVSEAEDFSSYITGYDNINVGTVTDSTVTGLTNETTYYFRITAETATGITAVSNIMPVTTGTEVPGNALEFDGVDDGVSLPYYANLNPASFTIASWIYVDGGTGEERPIIYSLSAFGGYQLSANTSDKFEFSVSDGSGNITSIESPESVTINQWTFIGCTFDGSKASLYINGELSASGAAAYAQNTGNMLYLAHDNVNSLYTKLRLDNTSIWDRELTQAEIQTLMFGYLEGNESNLMALYKYNQENSTTLNDYGINGYDGTLLNMNASEDWITSNTFTTWNGRESSDWHTKNNWSTNMYPISKNTSYHHVLIPDVTVQPVISVDAGTRSLWLEGASELTIGNNATLYVINNLIVGTDGTTTASLVDKNANGELYVYGTTKASLFLNMDQWWYISPPVSNAPSEVFDAVDHTNHYAYYWEEPTTNHGWNQITDNTTSLGVMKGYATKFIDGDKVAGFSGSINNGTLSIALTRTVGETFEGFNLVGNPYISAIDWGDETNDPGGADWLAKTNIENNSIWYRTNGTFATYNGNSGVGTNGGQRYIPAMQGFWVRVSSGQTTGELQVDNTVRTHGSVSMYKSAQVKNNTLLHLNVSNGTFNDEIALSFAPSATEGYDIYDTEKMFATNAAVPQLFTYSDGHKLAINSLPVLTGNRVIPLGFVNNITEQMTIRIRGISNLDPNVKVFLEDKITGEMHDMTDIQTYTFEANPSSDTGRFILHFNQTQGVLSQEPLKIKKPLNVYASGKTIYVNPGSDIGKAKHLTVFDITGKLIYQEDLNINNSTLHTFSLNKANGMYLVKLTGTNFSKTYRVFIGHK